MAKHNNIHLNKGLGQHFLTDKIVLEKIYQFVKLHCPQIPLLEVGPGAGALTDFLKDEVDYKLVEFDTRWVEYISDKYPHLTNRIINADFLKLDLNTVFHEPFAVVGNFPYNISSQIVFHILDSTNKVPIMLGMFQKELALRICATPGNKDYGVLSILTQYFYTTEYLFDVPKEAFNPPPKVVSGVMVMKKNQELYQVDYAYFKHIVKTAFNQRRKTLRNSLKSLFKSEEIKNLEIFDKRPEQLSLEAFVNLSNMLQYQQ